MAPEDFVYAIPADLAARDVAQLLCAGIIGYRAYLRIGIRPGGRLGLYGFGGSAHIAIQVARHQGCEVFVFSQRENHQQMAREMGAAWVGASNDEPPEPLHASILFAPAGELVLPALATLRRGGRLAIAGVGARVGGDARELLDLAAEIPIRTRVREHALEDANRALLELKRGQIRGAKVLHIT